MWGRFATCLWEAGRLQTCPTEHPLDVGQVCNLPLGSWQVANLPHGAIHMTTRRDFIKTTLAGSGVMAWGLSVPTFLSRAAAAAPETGKKGSKDTILVVVELTGGNDGLNTVVP